MCNKLKKARKEKIERKKEMQSIDTNTNNNNNNNRMLRNKKYGGCNGSVTKGKIITKKNESKNSNKENGQTKATEKKVDDSFCSIDKELQRYYGKYLRPNEKVRNTEQYFVGDVVKDCDLGSGYYLARVTKQEYIRVVFDDDEDNKFQYYNRLEVEDISNTSYKTIVTWHANISFVLAIGEKTFLNGSVDRTLLDENNVISVIEAGEKGLRDITGGMNQVLKYLLQERLKCSQRVCIKLEIQEEEEEEDFEMQEHLEIQESYEDLAMMSLEKQREYVFNQDLCGWMSNKQFKDCLAFLNKMRNKKISSSNNIIKNQQ